MIKSNQLETKEALETNIVKEGNEANSIGPKIPAKRVDIVSLKMVIEGSILYKNRKVSSPNDAVALIQDFLEDTDVVLVEFFQKYGFRQEVEVLLHHR